jgi:hypothetical protein
VYDMGEQWDMEREVPGSSLAWDGLFWQVFRGLPQPVQENGGIIP